MEAAIITTYRCVCRCEMCNIWKYPTSVDEEIKPGVLRKLPPLDFCNITGGEPFMREDIHEIVAVLREKAKRIVISTNGYFTDEIVNLARGNKDIGIRISLEGLPAANDELRGLKDGFDHGLRTLLELKRLGIKDIGFGITVSDRNAKDMLELYDLALSLGVEFATAVVHNSYYFHKHDNEISNPEEVVGCFRELVRELLKTRRIKNWFRAYFNYGLIRRIRGHERLLRCGAGTDMFFVDPWGEVRPCNGMDNDSVDHSMGNLHAQFFEEIWNGDRAKEVREQVTGCSRNCWMIGTAAPAMRRHFIPPIRWVLRNKLASILAREICVD